MSRAGSARASVERWLQERQEEAAQCPWPPPPPLPPATPLVPAAAEDTSLDCRLFAFSLVLHGCAQLTSLVHWGALPPSERAQRLGSIAWLAAFPLLAARAPRFYLAHRTAVLTLQRVVFYCFPLLRRPRGIQAVLDSEPSPGPRGALRDLLRIIWGARLVTVFMTPLVTPLHLMPLVPQLLLQLYALVMVRANDSLCRAPLLAHPLTANRIRGLHSALRLAAAMLPGGAGQTLNAQPARALGAQARCEAFLHVVSFWAGLVLPLSLLVKTEPARSLEAWDDAWAAHQAAWRAAPWPADLAAVLRRAAMVTEAGMRQLVGRSWLAPEGSRQRRRRLDALAWWERCVSWWALLAFSWLLSMTLG